MRTIFILLFSIVFLTACGSKPPKPQVAQQKSVEVDGKSLQFGGEYWTKEKEVVLFVNGDPVMRGNFPTYTPTLNLNTNYEDLEISSYCYFSSVLAKKKGIFGVVAGAVQNSHGKAGDSCEMKVKGEVVANLYF
jgi:hypothetical protein